MFEVQASQLAKQSHYEKALEIAETGMEIARSNKHHERSLELLTTLGNICTLKKDYEEAEDWYLFALQLECKIKKEYLFVSTHTHLGNLYMTLGRWDEAKEQLHIAVKIGEKSEDNIRYHLALVAIGDYYIQTRDHKKAIYYYEKAREQAEHHKFAFVDPDLYFKLSHSWKEVDSKKAESYLNYYALLKFNLEGE